MGAVPRVEVLEREERDTRPPGRRPDRDDQIAALSYERPVPMCPSPGEADGPVLADVPGREVDGGMPALPGPDGSSHEEIERTVALRCEECARGRHVAAQERRSKLPCDCLLLSPGRAVDGRRAMTAGNHERQDQPAETSSHSLCSLSGQLGVESHLLSDRSWGELSQETHSPTAPRSQHRGV